MLLSHVNYLIITLLTTNIWIISYRFILNYLNQIFPINPNPSFLLSGVAPEPFEIPLYIILSFIAVLLIYVLTRKIILRINLSLWQKRLLLILISYLFISQLGYYPLSESGQTPPYITPFLKNLAIPVAMGYVLLILFFISLITNFYIRRKKSRSNLLLYLIVILAIALLTYEPGFPISWHDYAYYFGPILEIAKGKTIFTQIPSQYGFISILTLATAVNLGIFQIGYLPFLIYLGYILQYFLCFYLVLKMSKSVKLSLVSLFSIITLNYYSLYHMPIAYPQVGPTRWLPMLLSLFIFSKYNKPASFIYIFLITLISFITIDVGISIILAFLCTLFLIYLNGNISVKKVISALLTLCASAALVFIAINILHMLLGYKPINPNLIFTKMLQYSQSGFNMIKLPEYTYFWLVILVYFGSVIYFFKKRAIDRKNQILLLSANLSLFGAIYFVGRSHPNNLFNISILFLINFYLLLSFFFQKLKSAKQKFVLIILFLLFIVFPSIQRRVSLSYIVYQKLNHFGIKTLDHKFPETYVYYYCKPQTIHLIKSELDECLWLRYKKEVGFINKNIKDRKIAIISPDDTYLLYLTNKDNLLDANPQTLIFTKEDLDFAIKKVIQVCPRKILVDPRVFNKPLARGSLNYLYALQPHILNKIQSMCNITYQELKCTENICLAEAKTIK